MSDLRERLVRALGIHPDAVDLVYAAFRPGDVLPGGLVVAPSVPTRQMAAAGNAEWDRWADEDWEDGSDERGAARIYRAMLSAIAEGEEER